MLLLKLKNWQVLSLIFIVPLILTVTGLDSALFVNRSNGLFGATIDTMVLMLPALIFFMWLWQVGTMLHKNLPRTVKMNLILFKVILVSLFIFAAVVSTYNSLHLTGKHETYIDFETLMVGAALGLISALYLIIFIAKALKVVETQKPANFNDYVDEFIWMFFWPVGIWKYQPRINEMNSNGSTAAA